MAWKFQSKANWLMADPRGKEKNQQEKNQTTP